MSTQPTDRAWLQLSPGGLRANFRAVRSVVGPDVGIIPAVKADAYGLGMSDVVRVLEPEGPAGYAVATVPEGETLRSMGFAGAIHLIGPLPRGQETGALRAGLVVSVSAIDSLRRLEEVSAAEGLAGGFQIEIDTGMGRAGFPYDRVEKWAPKLGAARLGKLSWVGAYTHFHSADEEDPRSASDQWSRFLESLSRLDLPEGPFLVHGANSAALLRDDSWHAMAVRPGIFLYGANAGVGLRRPDPVLALRAKVVHIRSAAPGTTVGYGATHVAEGDELWATLSIGYGDGLPRACAVGGQVLIRGRRVPVVGRISMDMTVVDISQVAGVEVGAVATLVGSDPEGGEAISIDEFADRCGTIAYEVLTGFTQRLPRLWDPETVGPDGAGRAGGQTEGFQTPKTP